MATATKKKTATTKKATTKKATTGSSTVPVINLLAMADSLISGAKGPLALFQRAQKGAVNATLEGNKQIHRTWFLLKAGMKAEVLTSVFFQIMMSHYGINRPEAIKRYLAHVLWNRRLQEDFKEHVDPVALTQSAYWCHILDVATVGWEGNVKDDLPNGVSVVKDYISWSRKGYLDNPAYPQGRYMPWSSYRYTEFAQNMSAASAAMKGLTPRAVTKVRKFIQVNNCETTSSKKPTAASRIRFVAIDPTNSLSPKEVQAELDRRKKAGCYEIVEL